MSERTATIPGVWASGATTTIPSPPTPGVAYRNTAIVESDLAAAQAYSSVFDSSKWNQALYLAYTLLQLLEQQGILIYSRLTSYSVGSLCLGTTGILYQCVAANGPSNIHTPAETAYWTPRMPPTYFAPVAIGNLSISTSLQDAPENTLDLSSILPATSLTAFLRARVSGSVSSEHGTICYCFGTTGTGVSVPVNSVCQFIPAHDSGYGGNISDFFFNLPVAELRVLRYRFVSGIPTPGGLVITLSLIGYA
jgi:hypothetical protein